MKHNYTAGRVLAILAGIAATLGALAILSHDAITTGHWSLDHALMPVVVGITILAGHLIGSALRSLKVLSAAGFALLFILGTALTVYTSVGRQAKIADTEDAAAAAVASQIDGLNAEISRINEKRTKADKMLTAAQTALADECGTGKGSRCGGRKATVDVYEAAVKGHDADVARIRKQIAEAGPVPVSNARAARMASVIAIFMADEDAAKARMTRVFRMFEPFALSLFLELTAIVAFGYAFGNRRKAKAPKTEIEHEPGPAAAAPVHVPKSSERRAAVHSFVAAHMAKHGTAPSIPAVQTAHRDTFGIELPKTTAWNWITEAKAKIEPVRRLRVVG